MREPRLFDANKMAWTRHPTFREVETKALETPATHPGARVTLVRIGPDGVIDAHVHDVEAETAYVLAGRGCLTLGSEETILETGRGVTIPPGLPHSLRNIGDIAMELIAVHVPTLR